MRASGAFALEQSLMARPTSPARMHFWMFDRNASLLIDALEQVHRALDGDREHEHIQNTMGHMPHPPSLKCVFRLCNIANSSSDRLCVAAGQAPGVIRETDCDFVGSSRRAPSAI
jgi:hypothetical protein